MPRRPLPDPTASPVADVMEAAEYIDRAAETPVEDAKLKAFNDVAIALKTLSQADKYAVLNAAAKFHGMSIKLDV